MAQADELGVSFFVIAGGEPLTRPEIMDITREFPHIVFLLFTNGMLLDRGLIARLAEQRNTVPVLSLEGNQAETDERRGRGVHERLERKMAELKAAGIFFALSLTVTRANFDTVTDRGFVRTAVAAGCRLFFLAEYTPIREGTDEWVITDAQGRAMRESSRGSAGASAPCSSPCPGTRRSRAGAWPRAAASCTSGRRATSSRAPSRRTPTRA